MYCIKCGAQLPDDARFCYKCGAGQNVQTGNADQANSAQKQTQPVIADSSITELKCPGCGAPIKPEFGEMVITCEYCGASISLGQGGWRGVQTHTMLPLKIADRDSALNVVKNIMDRGLLRRHLEEESEVEDCSLALVPYWIVPVSARTTYTAVDVYSEVGSTATTAALFGMMGGAFGGRGGMGTGLLEGTMIGGLMGGGFSGRNSMRAYTLDQNYQYPVVAAKALADYQPSNYQFSLADRKPFDRKKAPDGVKALNGDVGEEAAVYQAKTNVDALQATKVHAQHHMVQNIRTAIDTADPELLHVPVWLLKFDHKGEKIVLVMDGNSGGIINSIGLQKNHL